MTVQVLRVYDKNDDTAMTGERHFIVLPELEDADMMDIEIERDVDRISTMSWQEYTSYMIGTVEIEEGEMYYCEIIEKHLDGSWAMELCIDCDRVPISHKYSLNNY